MYRYSSREYALKNIIEPIKLVSCTEEIVNTVMDSDGDYIDIAIDSTVIPSYYIDIEKKFKPTFMQFLSILY